MKTIKAGDKVRVKLFGIRPFYWNHDGEMDYLMGQVVTVKEISHDGYIIRIVEDSRWLFNQDDFEPVCIQSKDVCLNIRRVIFNPPVTIVLWEDGTKTVVKCHNEPFDKEKGLAMALLRAKHGSGIRKLFKKWCADDKDET